MKNKHVSKASKVLAAILSAFFVFAGVTEAGIQNAGAETVEAFIKADDGAFDKENRSLTVDISLPGNTEAGVIAASYDQNGMVEYISERRMSGTASFRFNSTPMQYKVFAVDPETLMPLCDNAEIERETDESDIVELDEIELNLPTLDGAFSKAVGALMILLQQRIV